MEMETKPEPEMNPESGMNPEAETNLETEPKICPRCSAKNNPGLNACWKCQHSFLPWSIRVRFWAEGIPHKLISLVRHVLSVLVFLFFVGLCFFCVGLVFNVILGKMTTGQYIYKIKMDLAQSKQTIRNEWPGPILETIGRVTSVGGNGTSRKYFGNGSLKSETPYKNGEPDGFFRAYHENGRVRAEGLFKNGKLVGKFKEYYDNGFLKHEGNVTEAFER
jgi:ribosomal protein L40E